MIEVATVIGAPVERVWAHLEDIGSHVEWMHDAVAIRFDGDQRQGVGTSFVCDTRIGPLRTKDRMSITEWAPPRKMGVRHTGAVSGSGAFTLYSLADGATRLTWSEQLTFPWWLGGKLGEVVGAPILRFIWRRNLSHLKSLVEAA